VSRAVLFDVDGVLVHGYHARPERQIRWDERLLEDLGVDPERFRNEFIYGPFVGEVVIGKLPLIEALDRVLPSLGYRGSPMQFASYWLSHDSHVNEPLVDLVRRLKTVGQCRLFIATNQDHMRAQWLWFTLGFGELFEDIFYSARFGTMKPSADYFDAIEARIGPQDRPPLFFDDRVEIVEAARHRGWDAVLYDTLEDCSRHPWIAGQLAGTA
jgi:putative hydrolase of the HAD superfamily